MRERHFTVGPTQLHPEFEKFHKDAMNLNLGSIYHRSKAFHSLYQYTDEQMRQLLGLDAGYSIYFTSGGTEIWEKSILNLAEKNTFHLINGEFGNKYSQFANKLGKNNIDLEVPRATPFNLSDMAIPEETELICLTLNETSSGFCYSQQDSNALKEKAKSAIVSADAVSIAPLFSSRYRIFDSFFFSVQKAFGMPPGLGVWIVNEKCRYKAAQLKSEQKLVSAFHTLNDLEMNYAKWETPSSPNTIAIYILGCIAEWMNRKGIEKIETEIYQKASMIYDFISQSKNFKTIVNSINHRSPTTIVVQSKQSSNAIIQNLRASGLSISKGYGSYSESEIRIGNFPQTSLEDMSNLIEQLKHENESY